MAPFHQNLSSFLLLLLLFILVLALSGSIQIVDKLDIDADTDLQIEKSYIISKDDPATAGGCTPSQVRYLNEAYTEAMMMVRGAIRDIDTFNAPLPRRSKDNVNAVDQQKYDKIVIMLGQLFGIRTRDEENGGPKDREERDRLAMVRGE